MWLWLMMIQVLGLCHFVLNQRLYLKWKVKVGSDLSFSLWMFYGNKLSLSSTMGKELDLLPEKPKSLVTLPQSGVNPKCLPLSVFQQFCSFVTKIRTSMLPNKFYRGAIFVNSLHFCCITFYQSFSLIHHGIISFQRLVMLLTKCDQEKYIYVA